MDHKTIDTRGMVCPKPLILTKAALSTLGINDEMTVLVDNETSKQNVERFLRDNGVSCSANLDAGVYTLRVRKQADAPPTDARTYCAPQSSNVQKAAAGRNRAAVILFKSDKMGAGPDDLGGILIKAFINTIKELSPLPSALVFYTNGIHLVVEGSSVIEPLNDLQNKGVLILVCGTCLDYFKKKEQVKVGTVSDMFTILETLAGAHHVVDP
jgi:selenium metabolism protein YedF